MNGLRNKNLLLLPPLDGGLVLLKQEDGSLLQGASAKKLWKWARELSDATWEKEEETKKSPAGVKTRSCQPAKMFD